MSLAFMAVKQEGLRVPFWRFLVTAPALVLVLLSHTPSWLLPSLGSAPPGSCSRGSIGLLQLASVSGPGRRCYSGSGAKWAACPNVWGTAPLFAQPSSPSRQGNVFLSLSMLGVSLLCINCGRLRRSDLFPPGPGQR